MLPFIEVGVQLVFIPPPLLPQVEPLVFITWSKDAMQDAQQQAQNRDAYHRGRRGKAPQLVGVDQRLTDAEFNGSALQVRTWNPAVSNQVKRCGHESLSSTCRPNSRVRTSVKL